MSVHEAEIITFIHQTCLGKWRMRMSMHHFGYMVRESVFEAHCLYIQIMHGAYNQPGEIYSVLLRVATFHRTTN